MTRKPIEKKETFVIDKTLLAILIVFLITSLLGIYASAPHIGGSSTRYVIMQSVFYVISFSALLFICYWGLDRFFAITKILYWILLFMMVLLLVDKYGIFQVPFVNPVNHTWAWYQFPGFSFQPSEFMKIILVMLTAMTINTHNLEKEQNSFGEDIRLFIKVGSYTLPVLVLNFLQPDTGVPLIMVVSIMIMLLTSGIKRQWFILLAVFGIIGYFGIIYVYNNHVDWLLNMFGPSYRLDRFYAWLDYEKYRQGVGFQLYNAIVSLGSAGFSGIGLDGSIIYIPAAHTDFIFAVIGSTFGFIGSVFVIVLCFLLDVKLILIALRSQNNIGRYALIGIVGIFVFQQIQNIGMMIGLLPITGITLPLISYGGSSLLSYMVGLSFAFALSSETANNPNYEDQQVPLKELK